MSLEISIPSAWGGALRFCISKESPDGAEAAGQDCTVMTLAKHLSEQANLMITMAGPVLKLRCECDFLLILLIIPGKPPPMSSKKKPVKDIQTYIQKILQKI